MLLAIGCRHQVGGVTPSDSLAYRFYDTTTAQRTEIYGHHFINDKTEVLVGLPIEVEGMFAASCRRSTTPLGRDDNAEKWSDEYVPCKEQPTDVTVRCVGACSVRDRLVTPTAAGKLSVEVTLASRETGERTQLDHELVAVEPEDFELHCKDGPIASASGKVCVVRESVQVKIRAGTTIFTAPIMANGVVVRASRYAAILDLARVVGAAPTDASTPAPGKYDVELVFGTLRRVVSFEVE
jgi:hypothetical protein